MTSQSDIFLQRHRSQLTEMGLPTKLHGMVCEKILQQIFDGGSHFVFQERDDDNEEEDDGENIRRATTGKYTLHAVHDMEKHSEVVLIDHMWTTTFPQGNYMTHLHASLNPIHDVAFISYTPYSTFHTKIFAQVKEHFHIFPDVSSIDNASCATL